MGPRRTWMGCDYLGRADTAARLRSGRAGAPGSARRAQLAEAEERVAMVPSCVLLSHACSRVWMKVRARSRAAARDGSVGVSTGRSYWGDFEFSGGRAQTIHRKGLITAPTLGICFFDSSSVCVPLLPSSFQQSVLNQRNLTAVQMFWKETSAAEKP